MEGVRSRIAEAARRSGREPHAVTLVAVTKRNPPEFIPPLVELGVREFGENYPQELWKKAEAFPAPPMRWHLIGHLQGNKVKRTFPLVSTIHAVDSLKLLQSLDSLALAAPGAPRVCLQVNTSDEAAKHGWSAEQIVRDAPAIAACRNIPIVGLMTMAGLGTTAETARPSFVQLRELGETLRGLTGLPLVELSMGMSNDFETAVEEGATLVRVGSALFEGVAE